VNDSLPKTCQGIRGHLNAYLSGEVSPSVRDEVSSHLSVCESCSGEFESRLKLKESLKTAVGRSPVPPFLEARVRESLRVKKGNRRPLWIWVPAFGVAAALAFAVWTGWLGMRNNHPWEMARVDQERFIDTLYGQVGEVMRVGLGDHVHCTYFRKFPKNLPSAEELVTKIGPQYAALLPVVRQYAPAGDHVLMAHQCVFRDRSFIHIALDDHGKLVSLVITRKQPGESFGGGPAGLVGDSAGAKIYQAKAERFAVAGFEAGDYLAFVVSDHNEQENSQLAANLASPVRSILAEVQG
jgi:Putative zinc-finger